MVTLNISKEVLDKIVADINKICGENVVESVTINSGDKAAIKMIMAGTSYMDIIIHKDTSFEIHYNGKTLRYNGLRYVEILNLILIFIRPCFLYDEKLDIKVTGTSQEFGTKMVEIMSSNGRKTVVYAKSLIAALGFNMLNMTNAKLTIDNVIVPLNPDNHESSIKEMKLGISDVNNIWR